MRRDKQEDLLEGALRVFARDGYTRAGIQALANEAQVSTRTIYNQYGNKSALFRAVIVHSATRVAERQIVVADAAFTAEGSLRERLIDFGTAWAAEDPTSRNHFAMIKQVNAEIEHIEPDALAAWRAAGPLRVRDAVASHLGALDARGELAVDDTDLAAVHLIQLTAGAVEEMSAEEMSADERDRRSGASEIIRRGVDVFLAAYGTSTAR